MISLRDAMIIAFHKGLYLESAVSETSGFKGAMCAVGMSQTDCENLLESYPWQIALAAVNSLGSCTISADVDEEVVEAYLKL